MSDTVESENREDAPEVVEQRAKASKKLVYTFWTLLVAVVVIFALAIWGVPAYKQHQSQQELDRVRASYGSVVLRSSSSPLGEQERGQTVPGTNPEQLKLTSTLAPQEKHGFTFASDKFTAGGESRQFTLFLDLSSQRSRDFITMGRPALEGYLRSSQGSLTVVLVPTDKPFATYAAEALAESAVTSPKASWKLLQELAKVGTENKWKTQEEALKEVLRAVEAAGVTGVDEASLTNGTFASWELQAGQDERLKEQYPPALFRRGEELVSPEDGTLMDPATLAGELKR